MNEPSNPSRGVEWAAGLFEGEGSFAWCKGNKSVMQGYMRAALKMTDEQEVRDFAAIVGVGKVTGPTILAAPRKPVWSWYAQNPADFEHVAKLLWPYLGERRRAKVEEVREANRQYKTLVQLRATARRGRVSYAQDSLL